MSLGRPVTLAEVLPQHSWWRLYVDAGDHAQAVAQVPTDPGRLYDLQESPGFQASMVQAYRSVLNDPAALRARIDWDVYSAMHAMVTEHIHQSGEKDLFEISGADPGIPTHSYVHDVRVSEDLMAEQIGERPLVTDARSMSEIEAGRRIVEVGLFEDGELMLKTRYRAEHLPGLVNAVFDNYYHDMARAATEHERLRAIARVVRTLHVLHPFGDGNRRNNVYLLLPRLLLADAWSGFSDTTNLKTFSASDNLFVVARQMPYRSWKSSA